MYKINAIVPQGLDANYYQDNLSPEAQFLIFNMNASDDFFFFFFCKVDKESKDSDKMTTTIWIAMVIM